MDHHTPQADKCTSPLKALVSLVLQTRLPVLKFRMVKSIFCEHLWIKLVVGEDVTEGPFLPSTHEALGSVSSTV